MAGASSDVAFSPSVKRIQAERGSREAYARIERRGGFEARINDELREFLARVDTTFLATASKDGQPYVQHRGGPRGFLRVLDDTTLGFADFTGNRQYVTTGNLAENDRVCLLAIDYATRQRVKVWGTARVVEPTPDLIAALRPGGERGRIEQVILLTVSAWDVNCPQHIPQKLAAAEVATALAERDRRIAELERANHELRAQLAATR
jgi:predicted pyridoxine 5'-phosphate oxidase superfamily flavin-nucleotide-binding protein